MKRVVLLVALLMSSVGHAQVYKCNSGGSVTYSERPCDTSAKPIDLKVYTPTPAERMAAIERAQIDREDADVVELQRRRHYEAAGVAASTNAVVRDARRQNNCDWFRKQARDLELSLARQTNPTIRESTMKSIRRYEEDARLMCAAR